MHIEVELLRFYHPYIFNFNLFMFYFLVTAMINTYIIDIYQ